MNRRAISFALVVVLFTGAAVAAMASGQQQTGADFFKGKTINFVVTNGPGSGFDTYARALAPYIQKYIPGSTVIVTDVEDAGGIIGQNQVYRAAPNGLTICMTSGAGMMLAQLRGLPGVQYDLAKQVWLGRVAAETHVVVVSLNSPFKTFKDVMNYKQPFRFSGSDVGSDDYIATAIWAEALNIPVTQVVYNEEGGEWLAVVKGDTWGVEGSWGTVRQFIDDGDVLPVLQITTARDPLLANVPTITEVVDAEHQGIAKAVAGLFAFDRVICGPPGMSAERTQILRDAISKSFDDPGYQADLAKLKRVHRPASGVETEQIMKDAFAQADQLSQILKTLPVVED
jgi:tripartite-type tricarboxylate transporter receptor subunit TctC